MAVPPLGKHPGAPTDPLGVFLVAGKMGLRLEVKTAHMSGSHTATRAVSTDILHFRARVLAVYGQGMFMGNL